MADHADHEPDPDARTTSPMQKFTGRQVGIGFAILLVGLLIAYGIPALL